MAKKYGADADAVLSNTATDEYADVGNTDSNRCGSVYPCFAIFYKEEICVSYRDFDNRSRVGLAWHKQGL